MDETSVNELLAEIGVDMEVFPSAEHLTSWAGLAPGNNESAGKKSSHTNHGNNVAASTRMKFPDHPVVLKHKRLPNSRV